MASASLDPGPGGIKARRTLERGNVQPDEQPWNVQGIGNNCVPRVDVKVRTPTYSPDGPASCAFFARFLRNPRASFGPNNTASPAATK